MTIFIFKFLFFLKIFILCDYLIGKNAEGKYYFIHFLNNFYLTYICFNDLLLCYGNLNNVNNKNNIEIVSLVYALHIYHIIVYFNKLRFNDWLHHILMIFVALPTVFFVNMGPLLSYSLFFLCGLPGCINYFLLFLNRNDYVSKFFQKKINMYLNLWIRCPGCISSSTLLLKHFIDRYLLFNNFERVLSLIGIILVYWNGVYFMNQVIVNYLEFKINKKKLKN